MPWPTRGDHERAAHPSLSTPRKYIQILLVRPRCIFVALTGGARRPLMIRPCTCILPRVFPTSRECGGGWSQRRFCGVGGLACVGALVALHQRITAPDGQLSPSSAPHRPNPATLSALEQPLERILPRRSAAEPLVGQSILHRDLNSHHPFSCPLGPHCGQDSSRRDFRLPDTALQPRHTDLRARL
jgi:hypothetical protein